MKGYLACFLLFGMASMMPAAATQANPLSKVIQLMDDLTAKIIKEGEEEQKAYVKFFEWCDDFAKTKGFEIKTATALKEKLEAKIEELTGTIEECTSKIEDLSGDIAADEKDLKDATLVREKEVEDFEEAQAELVETISALSRAIGILEKEMAKNPAFAQIDASNFQGVLNAFSVLVDSAAFSTDDRDKLVALAQTQQNSDEEGPGAPDPAAYKSHSTNILDVLNDMKDKADEQLSTLRMEETKTKQNYDLLKQSLEDQIAADNKEKKEEEDLKSASKEGKAKAEEDLSLTNKELADAKKSLADSNSECMTVASDHDATVAGRKEELKAIATAKKILSDTTSGAEEETYGFIQVRMRTHADLAGAEVVSALKKLASESKDASLAQLASQVAATMQYGASAGEDPFVKVKGLIKDMIAKLTATMNAEAEEKAWCDEQMAKTEAKQTELEDDVAKLTSKIDQDKAASGKLKDQVRELQSELAALAKLQSKLDSVRAEEHAVYTDAKAELEQGLKGVRKALGVLRDYYGGSAAAASMLQEMDSQPAKPKKFEKAEGAGGSIIDILEVVESDFSKNLSEVEMEETDSQSQYDKVTQENAVTKTEKTQDVKYKTQEFISLDKSVATMNGDRKSTQTELDAVNEYYDKVKGKCVAKPESYEERKKKRANEIAGLKQALSILENETAFTQQRKRSRHSRFLGL